MKCKEWKKKKKNQQLEAHLIKLWIKGLLLDSSLVL